MFGWLPAILLNLGMGGGGSAPPASTVATIFKASRQVTVLPASRGGAN